MEVVSRMQDRDFEFLTQPLQPDGQRLIIRVSKVGGGTVGQAYEGRWMYRIKRMRKFQATVLIAEGDDLNTGTPKTHKEAAEIAADFVQDLIPD